MFVVVRRLLHNNVLWERGLCLFLAVNSSSKPRGARWDIKLVHPAHVLWERGLCLSLVVWMICCVFFRHLDIVVHVGSFCGGQGAVRQRAPSVVQKGLWKQDLCRLFLVVRMMVSFCLSVLFLVVRMMVSFSTIVSKLRKRELNMILVVRSVDSFCLCFCELRPSTFALVLCTIVAILRAIVVVVVAVLRANEHLLDEPTRLRGAPRRGLESELELFVASTIALSVNFA